MLILSNLLLLRCSSSASWASAFYQTTELCTTECSSGQTFILIRKWERKTKHRLTVSLHVIIARLRALTAAGLIKDNTLSCAMSIHPAEQIFRQILSSFFFLKQCIFLPCWLRFFLLASFRLTYTHRRNTIWAHTANKHNKRECESVAVNHTELHGNNCPNFNAAAVDGAARHWNPGISKATGIVLEIVFPFVCIGAL